MLIYVELVWTRFILFYFFGYFVLHMLKKGKIPMQVIAALT